MVAAGAVALALALRPGIEAPANRAHVAAVSLPAAMPPSLAPRAVLPAGPDASAPVGVAPLAFTPSGTYPTLPIPAKLPYVEGAADDEITEAGRMAPPAPIPPWDTANAVAPPAPVSDPPARPRKYAEGADDDEGTD
jgi:hypothetical protein